MTAMTSLTLPCYVAGKSLPKICYSIGKLRQNIVAHECSWHEKKSYRSGAALSLRVGSNSSVFGQAMFDLTCPTWDGGKLKRRSLNYLCGWVSFSLALYLYLFKRTDRLTLVTNLTSRFCPRGEGVFWSEIAYCNVTRMVSWFNCAPGVYRVPKIRLVMGYENWASSCVSHGLCTQYTTICRILAT